MLYMCAVDCFISQAELQELIIAMNVPHFHTTAERDKFTILEGLCILLRRLVFPCRWMDVVWLFGRSASSLSRIFHYMLQFITENYNHLFAFNVHRFRHRLSFWSQVVRAQCPNAYMYVALFLDGTMRPMCRPGPCMSDLPVGISRSDVQRAQYDGRKKRHGFKYHTVIAPNGLCVHGYGPVDGRRHDTTIVRESGLWDSHFDLTGVDGIDYMIYADSAYAVTRNMLTPYRNVRPGSVEAALNTTMARARTVASENMYGLVTNTFQTIDFIRWQRAFWTSPSKQYLCAIFFYNVMLCLRGYNKVSSFFNCDGEVPTLLEYLAGTW